MTDEVLSDELLTEHMNFFYRVANLDVPPIAGPVADQREAEIKRAWFLTTEYASALLLRQRERSR